MNKVVNNSIIAVKKIIDYYHLQVSKGEIEKELLSDPDFPSLAAFHNAFKKWNIKCFGVQLSTMELANMNSPFIAHTKLDGKRSFAFVSGRINELEFEYYDPNLKKSTTKSLEKFSNEYLGVAFVISPDQNSGEKDFLKKKADKISRIILPIMLSLGFALLLFLNTYQPIPFSWENLMLLPTKAIGLILSFLILLKELNISNKLSDGICKLNSRNSCDDVLKSSSSNAFGLFHWSDIGLSYFATGVLALFLGNGSNILWLVSLAAVGFIPYSLYHQYKVIGSWCPLCLGIQLIFLLEAIFAISWSIPIDIPETTEWLAPAGINFIILSSVVLFKDYYKARIKLASESLDFLRLKRSPGVFNHFLFTGKKLKLNDSYSYVFETGNKEDSIQITLFLSLNCVHCRKVFIALEHLMFEENINFSFAFRYKVGMRYFVNQLHELFQSNKSKPDAIKMLRLWYVSSPQQRALLLKESAILQFEDVFRTIRKNQRLFFELNKVGGTPTLYLNGYRVDEPYKQTDIVYFINDLIHTDSLQNRKIFGEVENHIE